ncbi:UPF0235 protein [Bacteroidia bacterium]|nr:UPF0235 protein [Bacteroidia bacterium]
MTVYRIRVTPRAKRNEIVEELADCQVGRVSKKLAFDQATFGKGHPTRYRVYVTAAPADGAANRAVIKLLAEHLGVAKSKIRIIRGETSRDKLMEIN